jgi:segregation and condensation protein B
MPRANPEPPERPEPDSLEAGRAAAAEVGAEDWQLEAEPDAPLADEAVPVPVPAPISPKPSAASTLFPNKVISSEAPPSPEQILEAMLFVSGEAVTATKACAAIRGLRPEQFRDLMDELMKKYRLQNRPYTLQPRDDGYILQLKPHFRYLREKLFGGPREARLSQAALDVLSLVAYRQPLPKTEVDALRGADSAGPLRQLLKLGLIAVTKRAEAGNPAVSYGTTRRFLELFGLGSLDDLPRLGDAFL